MQAKTYMNAASLIESLKVGILASELDIIAANTKKTAKSKIEKEWARKMRMAATMMENVITDDDARRKFTEQERELFL